MKVRINQAIELKEVPNRVHELLMGFLTETEKLSSIANDGLITAQIDSDSPMKYRLLLSIMEEYKEAMGVAEQSLIDIQSILEGYVGIIEAPTAPLPEPAQPQPQPASGQANAD
tara:strand:- start:143 stop:484 length:342 start_codon:yes stop_codon:yes gene_type:complete